MYAPYHFYIIYTCCVGITYSHLIIMQTSTGEAVVDLYKKSSKLRGRVGDILDRVLHKHYPEEVMDGSSGLTLDELMGWELWPTYITVYSQYNTVV